MEVNVTPNIYKNLLINTPVHYGGMTPGGYLKTPISDSLKINEIDRNWETSS